MQNIRETALVRFDSLFTPGRKLWTLQNLRRFHVLFVERFDDGEGLFLEKFRTQLDGADDDVYQLAAELLYVQQFFTSLTGPAKKIENVQTVLSWSTRPAPIPDWAVVGVKRGLAGDQSFNQHRPFHLAWLNEFLIDWQSLPEADRLGRLDDPWRFAKAVRGIEFSRGAHQPMREAWLYLIFPDTFENISSRKDKKLIREAFKSRLAQGMTDNIDADLLAIRKSFSPQEDEGFHFYRSPLIEQWQTERKKTKGKDGGVITTLKGAFPQHTTVSTVGLAEPPMASLNEIGAALFLDPPSALRAWADLLLDSRQVIFQGPPGTGKTFMARKLGASIAGDPSRVELVQFTPILRVRGLCRRVSAHWSGNLRAPAGSSQAARYQSGECP